jgi:Zn-dependent protease
LGVEELTMRGNIAEFRVLGIDVKVHWAFLLILFLGAFTYGAGPGGWLLGGLYGVATMLLVFVGVTLHEFGHALAARAYGIGTRGITLLPLGGVANLERIPEKPRQELVITAAGPAVNLAIALVLLPVAWVVGGGAGLGPLAFRDALTANLVDPGLGSLLRFLIATNVLLAIFNLLPAFPLDGGRVVRALLALRMSYVRATQVAVTIGRIMAVLMVIWGIWNGGFTLLLIAVFIFFGGTAELQMVQRRHMLRGLTVRDVLSASSARVYVSEALGRVADLLLNAQQTDFAVFDLAGRFAGVLTRSQLLAGLRALGPAAPVAQAMTPAGALPVCAPAEDLITVWERMLLGESHVAIVIEGGHFLGILSERTLAEAAEVQAAKRRGQERPPTLPGPASQNRHEHHYA